MDEFSGITDGVDEVGEERKRGILMGKDSNLSWGIWNLGSLWGPHYRYSIGKWGHPIKHWKCGSRALRRSQELGPYLVIVVAGTGEIAQVEAKKASQGKSGSK